jgi:hypothetical protein
VLRLRVFLAILLATPFAAAQMQGGGQGAGISSGSGSENGSTSARNPADDVTAVAPPFDVEDILRMSRVGLQDEVIINALRARFHPMQLTAQDLQLLRKHSVSEAVIAVMENPQANPKDVKPASCAPGTESSSSPATCAPGNTPVPEPPAGDKSVSSATAEGSASTQPAENKNKEAKQGLPQEPGIYRRIPGAGWEMVSGEKVQWAHDLETPTRNIHGQLSGPMSKTFTKSAETDFLIVTPERLSIVQYQLLKLHVNKGIRTFQPGPNGHAFGGLINQEVIPYTPQRISPTVWLISLNNPLQGEYGFLRPQNSVLHSSTGFDDQIYTFHVF